MFMFGVLCTPSHIQFLVRTKFSQFCRVRSTHRINTQVRCVKRTLPIIAQLDAMNQLAVHQILTASQFPHGNPPTARE